MIFLDNYRHKGLRQQLVSDLKSKGIQDMRVLKAFTDIPRHFFLEPIFAEWAYKDVAFPIEADQTISQPLTVAKQTILLNVKKGDKILEIGTGSGFQACVLHYLGAKVYTIERQQQLFERTSKLLDRIGFSGVRTLYGDGYDGAPRFAPFDKIIVTAGASEIPPVLMSQLKIGGIIVIPCGFTDNKTMLRITKTSETTYESEECGLFRFVPFIKGLSHTTTNV
jgi:protein-L-isoaspartate(D-aspartate) O-methyltransferase